jgi:hypothetical protein
METVAVQGKVKDVTLPRHCASCFAPVSEQIPVEEVFHFQDEPTVLTLPVWFCADCAAQHWREAKRYSLFERLRPVILAPQGISIVSPTLFGLFLLSKWPGWMGRSHDPVTLLAFGGIALGFVGFGLVMFWITWRSTRHRFVVPRTSITSAVHFTGNQSAMFEPAWHKFLFRNPGYAQEFASLNAHRLWNPHGAEAQRARQLRQRGKEVLLGAALVAAVLYGFAWVQPDFLPWLKSLFTR